VTGIIATGDRYLAPDPVPLEWCIEINKPPYDTSSPGKGISAHGTKRTPHDGVIESAYEGRSQLVDATLYLKRKRWSVW